MASGIKLDPLQIDDFTATPSEVTDLTDGTYSLLVWPNSGNQPVYVDVDNLPYPATAQPLAGGLTDKQNFNGDGLTTAFQLSVTPTSVNHIIVAVGQAIASPSFGGGDGYSLSGNIVSFTTAPPAGTNNIQIWTLSDPTTPTASGDEGDVQYAGETGGLTSSTSFNYTSGTGVLIVPHVTLSGNITVSGTVDGRDIATDGAKLDGIATGANLLTDHQSLTGRTDASSHTIFPLLDGTRPFTGVQSGVTPVSTSDLATKGYVDGLLDGVTAWRDPVIDKDLTAPPGGASIGDRYIVAATATGAWAGQEQNIAVYNGSGWDFTTPSQGWALIVTDESILYVYDTGNGWTDDRIQYHNDARADTWLSSKSSDDLANNSTVSGSTVSDAIEQAATMGPAGDGSVEPAFVNMFLCGGNHGTGDFTEGDRENFTEGTQFLYPGSHHYQSAPIYNLWREHGARLARIPFKWQDVQPDLNGALKTANTDKLKESVDLALSYGYVVLLDMHDYGRRYVNGTIYEVNIDPELTTAHLVDVWEKIAALFPTTTEKYKRVWFELMNEPTQSVSGNGDWYEVVEAVIKALRDQGNWNHIGVPPTVIQKVNNFLTNGNAAAYLTMLSNLETYATGHSANLFVAYHIYFDKGGGGGDTSVMARGPANDTQQALADWHQTNNVRLMFSETGWGSSTDNLSGWDTGPTVDYYLPYFLKWWMQFPDVFIGWAHWVHGFGWPQDGGFTMIPEGTNGKTETWNNPPILRAWTMKTAIPYWNGKEGPHIAPAYALAQSKLLARQSDGTAYFDDFSFGLHPSNDGWLGGTSFNGSFEGPIEVKTNAARGESNGGSGLYGLRFSRPGTPSGTRQAFQNYKIPNGVKTYHVTVEFVAKIEAFTDPLDTSEHRILHFGTNGNYSNLAYFSLKGNPCDVVATMFGHGDGTSGSLVSGLVGTWHTWSFELDMTSGNRAITIKKDGVNDSTYTDSVVDDEPIHGFGLGLRTSDTPLTIAYDSVRVIIH